MATLTAAELRQYLQVMKDLGVREFHWGDMRIEFGPAQEETRPPGFRQPAVREAKTLFENAALWPGGQPPKFPGQE